MPCYPAWYRIHVRPALNESARVATLNGVRGVAIAAVLMLHTAYWSAPIARVDHVVAEITSWGWAGVDLFFVLSGFLITGILLDSKGHPGYFRNFYARRTLRIFPLYYICVALVVSASFLPLVMARFPQAATNIRHVQGWYWTYTTNYLIAWHGFNAAPMRSSHFWSLAVEEQFYLLWPTVVLLANRRTLTRICVALLVICPLLRAGLWLAHASPMAAWVLTPTRIDTLAVGALLAIAARSDGGLRRWHRLVTAAGVVGTLFITVSFVARSSVNRDYPEFEIFGYSAIAAICAALVVAAMTADAGTRTQRVLSSRALGTLGRYSYGLYVVHFPIIGLLHARGLAPDAAPAVLGSHLPAQLAFSALGVAASFAVALASWYCLEQPMLRLKAYFPYGSTRGPARASSSAVGPRAAPSI